MADQRLTPDEIRQADIGSQIEAFLLTAGGQWLMTRVKDGRRQIAEESLFSADAKVSPDFYRGRASELASLESDISNAVARAREITADGDEDDEDTFTEGYDGPQLGSGTPAAVGRRGDFGA